MSTHEANHSTDGPKAILIVDDNESLCDVLRKTVEKMGLNVFMASNGKIAYQIFKAQKIDVVLSDINMPEMDGIELAKAIKGSEKPVPVILMTAFSDILETQEAHSVGVEEFFAKPFNREELFNAIRRCLRKSQPGANGMGEESNDESEFCKLGIEDFTSGRQIRFNIFIRLTAKKFVKIGHQGDDISLERVRAFKAKGVHFLYLRKEDFREYVGFTLFLGATLQDNPGVSKQKKLNLVKHTGEVILEHVRKDGIDREMFDSAASFVETTVSVLSDEKNISDLLSILNSHADFVYAHSVGVSLYGVMLARSVGWNMPNNLFKVAMGGLLHDVGEKEVDRAILFKARKDWTPEDVKIYESHPRRGREALMEIKGVPEDVLQIVCQHHENYQATGFPARLRPIKIHPMAKLIGVINIFCDLIISSPGNAGLRPEEALEQMSKESADCLDPQFFESLMLLCQFEPSADFRKRRHSGHVG